MAWDALITRLRLLERSETEPLSLATTLRRRVELELSRCDCTDLPESDKDHFGDSLDQALEDATAGYVSEALRRVGTPREGQTSIEALCESLDQVLVQEREAWQSLPYTRHRSSSHGQHAVYRYLKLSTFLRHVLRVPLDRLPRPGTSSRGEVASSLRRGLKRLVGENQDLGPKGCPVWVCGWQTAPHVRDPEVSALEAARTLALAGLEEEDDRRIAMGLVALRVDPPPVLHRPTITEAMAPGARWFFPGPKGASHGRTRPLNAELTSWGADLDQGVDEWLLPPTKIQLASQDGKHRLVWWQLFREFESPDKTP